MGPNTIVSEVWFRAWKSQVARMKTHPEELRFLMLNAQLSQANYVMNLATESVELNRK